MSQTKRTNDSYQHSIQLFCSFEIKIRSELHDWGTYDKWVLQTKIQLKYFAPFERKISSESHDWGTDKKWISYINILFKYFSQLEGKIWSVFIWLTNTQQMSPTNKGSIEYFV